MKRLLLVSIAFPPKNDPECLQVDRYVKYMLRQNIDFDVVTSPSPTLFMDHDKSLSNYGSAKMNIVWIRIFEWKAVNYLLRRLLPSGINFPDSKFSFHLQWKKVVSKLSTAPQLIYSRSNPVSSALMAFKLQKYYDVPWVMHLSDPWVDSPAASYTNQERSFNEIWEKRCFAAATKISVTTEAALNFYSLKYPEFQSKFFISPNVFDHETINFDPIVFDRPFTIVYTGGLAGDRTAEFFLEAIKKAVLKDSRLLDSEIIFAGPIDKRNARIIKTSGLRFVKHVGNVSFTKSVALQRNAHILLSIDQPVIDPMRAMFFPSKILDYLTARRHILAITNRESATARALSEYDATVVCYPDLEALETFLLKAVGAFHDKNVSFFEMNIASDSFSASRNSSNLVSLLKSI